MGDTEAAFVDSLIEPDEETVKLSVEFKCNGVNCLAKQLGKPCPDKA